MISGAQGFQQTWYAGFLAVRSTRRGEVMWERTRRLPDCATGYGNVARGVLLAEETMRGRVELTS